MLKLLRKISVFILSATVLVLVAAIAMVHTDEPTFERKFASTIAVPAAPLQECSNDARTRCITTPDGVVLSARHYAGKGDVAIVLLHGILSSSAELEEMAEMLRSRTGAEVWSLDLRGHGKSQGRRGDIDFIGQYENDVAAVVAAVRASRPASRVVLAGHSMGGGIAVRYAQRRDLPSVDAYLLLAPHLGHRSPTTRREAPASKEEPLMKLHLARTLGLVALNIAGITSFNDRPTLFFNLPAGAPIDRYSFRAMVSTSPDDYVAALSADARPMLIVVGMNDEAFVASKFTDVVRHHRNGTAVLIERETHDSITRSPRAFDAIERWMRALPRRSPASTRSTLGPDLDALAEELDSTRPPRSSPRRSR